MLAELLLAELPQVVADPWHAAEIGAALTESLAEPADSSRAQRRLRRALTLYPELDHWRAQRAALGHSGIRERLMAATRDRGIPARFLSAESNAGVAPGGRVQVRVAITEQARDRSARCQPFAVPPEGVTVTLLLTAAPGLEVYGPDFHEVSVPEHGDSPWYLFELVHVPGGGATDGPVTATIYAFVEGRPVADLTVAAEVGAARGALRAESAGVPSLDEAPGQLTLRIAAHEAGYRCSLVHAGDRADGVVAHVPTDTVEAVRRFLVGLASGVRHTDPAMARHELCDLGLELWDKALPAPVRRRFEDLLAGARTLTILSDDRHRLPWELLLPAPGRIGKAFLAEKIAVLRRITGQQYPGRIDLRDAAYVHPADSPPGTYEEIDQVHMVLGGGVRHRRPSMANVRQVVQAVDAGDFDLLHLACHNRLIRHGWDEVAMNDGGFSRIHLNQAIHGRTLAPRHPLIFFNACDTDGGATETRMDGWAGGFLRAGAGAFVGSTWAVRSATATRFAEHLYAFLPSYDVGTATLRARLATGDEAGDPTPLAYAVYATPGTVVRWGLP